MATLSIVATVEPDNWPPRVRLDVTDTGSPSITSVRVTRLDPSGQVLNVRTENGQPLTLQASGSDRVGTVYDYEMPYGQIVTYSTTQDTSVTSGDVTVDESRIWLIHPGIPARSMPIELMRGSFGEEVNDINVGVFSPMNRTRYVTISDGRRKATTSEMVVGTDNPADRLALRELLADGFPLLLNVPPLTGIDVATVYVQIGPVRRQRPSDVGSAPERNWVLPFWVVDMPVGGSQSQRTYQTVLDEHATYQDVLDAYDSYADLQAPTT